MTPQFILPHGYDERMMELALTKSYGGWKFVGRDGRFTVPARKPNGDLFFKGEALKTKQDAAIMARALGFPAYAIWNGRKGSYDGQGAVLPATVLD